MRIRKSANPIDRFMSHVSPEPMSGCWLWTGYCDREGYGNFHVGRRLGGSRNRNEGAHRVSYKLFVGPIPEGLQIDHLCRVRSCVNPKHLEAVTNEVNWRRGNLGHDRNTCRLGHEYTKSNTFVFHNMAGVRFRVCRECKNARRRKTKGLRPTADTTPSGSSSHTGM